MVEPLVVRNHVERDEGVRVVDPVILGVEAAPDGAALLPVGKRPDWREAQALVQEAGQAAVASCPEAALASEDPGRVEAPALEAGNQARVVCSSQALEVARVGRWGASGSGVDLEGCHLVVESGTAVKGCINLIVRIRNFLFALPCCEIWVVLGVVPVLGHQVLCWSPPGSGLVGLLPAASCLLLLLSAGSFAGQVWSWIGPQTGTERTNLVNTTEKLKHNLKFTWLRACLVG